MRNDRTVFVLGDIMSRENRIKLYKRIRNKYNNNASDLPHEEQREAIEAGYLLMGQEVFTSHNEAIQKAKERAAAINKDEIADAFLYSLSTALCEYRSPLLSYYYIQSVNLHDFDNIWFYNGKAYYSSYCNICKYDNEKEKNTTFLGVTSSSFNSAAHALVQKYLFGSVCWFEYYIDYCIMDITQYLTMPKVKSSMYDRKILINALNLTKTLHPTDKAGAYIKRLYESKIIPNSTKNQISIFVDTLGSLNILHKAGDYAITKGKDKYDNSYREAVEYKNDHPFPLTHWRASDGVDWDEVQSIFNINLS